MFKAICLNKERGLRGLIKMIVISLNLRMRKSFPRCRVLDAIYFLYSAFACLIVFGILCLIWDEQLMKIKVFLLLLCMFFVLCFAITLPFCF